MIVPRFDQQRIGQLCLQAQAGRAAEAELRRGGIIAEAVRQELAQRVAAGREAEAELVRVNTGLVRMVARRYAAIPGHSLDDLMQAGFCGLLKAIWLFEPERNVKFSVYATWQIRASMTDEVRRPSLPQAAESSHPGGTGRRSWRRRGPPPIEHVPDPRADRPQPPDLSGALGMLPPRERQALSLRYGLDGHPPHTVAQVAEAMGISPPDVGRLLRQAIAILRQNPPDLAA